MKLVSQYKLPFPSLKIKLGERDGQKYSTQTHFIVSVTVLS